MLFTTTLVVLQAVVAPADTIARIDSVYREAIRIGVRHGVDIWPGFRPDTIPMSFVLPSRSLLYGWRAAAPAGYVRVAGHPDVFWRDDRSLGAASTSTTIEGRPVAQVVVQGSSAELAATAIHEAFHVFERASARPSRTFGAGENSMLVSTYPVFDVDNETAFALEGRILAASMRTSDVAVKRKLAREFVSVRRERHRVLDPQFAVFDAMSELNEGLAEYALVRALQSIVSEGPSAWRAGATRALRAKISLLDSITRSENLSLRFRYYQTGPALALLADALAGNRWKEYLLTENATVQDALAWASGLDAGAISARRQAEKSYDRPQLIVDARSSIAALQKSRRAMTDSLLALPGLKLVLLADSLPDKTFNACGYDPQNLLQVGGRINAQMRWWKPCAAGPTTAEFNVPSIHDEDAGAIRAVIGAEGDVRMTAAGQSFTLGDGERRLNVRAFALDAPRASVRAVRADVSRKGREIVVVPKRGIQ